MKKVKLDKNELNDPADNGFNMSLDLRTRITPSYAN
jgi:hypothetical protein